MDRATALFAAHLETSGGRLTEPAFTSLLAEHPDLRAELLELRDGLALFQSQRAALRAHAARVEQERKRWRRVAGIGVGLAAAAVVVVLACRYFDDEELPEAGALHSAPVAARRGDERAPPPLTSGTPSVSEVAAELARRGAALLHEVVGADSAFDVIAAEENSEVTEKIAVRGTAGFYFLMESVVEAQPEPQRQELRGDLEQVRETLGSASPENWRSELLATLDGAESDLPPGRAFLTALGADPALRKKIDALVVDPGAKDAIAQFVLLLQGRPLLRLRAVDVSSDWRDVEGARVFAQQVDLRTQQLGAPRELGRTPLPLTAMDPGDWRITVIDSSGSRPRFSELHLLMEPGADLGVQFAFFRETRDVLQSMVLLPACTSFFGMPPSDATPLTTDPLQSECEIGEFAIDPYEVTCAEYSDFYRDLAAHRSWFGGALPIARPAVLEPDGSCRAILARYPIVGVDWYASMLYANWAGKRLPTEREWERAARGTKDEDRRFPWGGKFEAACINTAHSVWKQAEQAAARGQGVETRDPQYETLRGMAVDAPEFEQGATPAVSGRRIHRMADNVAEYVEDLYTASSRRDALSLHDDGGLFRTAKGGWWHLAGEPLATSWRRAAWTSHSRTQYIGFRCVKTPVAGFVPN